MRIQPIVLAVILTGRVLAQDHKPWAVDRLCGILKHVEKIPDHKHPNVFSETSKSLRDVPLSLYERSDNKECCDGSPLSTIRTERGGHFEFKDTRAGSYWLVANWNGKDHKVAVTYQPQRRSSTVCSEQGVQVYDAGGADWWVTVTVD